MDKHGEDASVHAAKKADAYLEAGNMEVVAIWIRIVLACQELLSMRREGAALN